MMMAPNVGNEKLHRASTINEFTESNGGEKQIDIKRSNSMPTVPRPEAQLSDDLFEFYVEVSMLEIYNEMVRTPTSHFFFHPTWR